VDTRSEIREFLQLASRRTASSSSGAILTTSREERRHDGLTVSLDLHPVASHPLYDGRAPSGDSIVVEPRSERRLFGVDDH
jgi:hypothetical protein